MKSTLIALLTVLSFSTFAETGMEKNSTPEKVNYLFSPLNHLQTHVSLGATLFSLKSSSVDTDAKPGIKLGVSAEMGQGLVYVLGLQYMNLKSELDIGASTVEFQLDYLNLLLGAKYYLAGANSGFFIKGHLTPGLLINDDADNIAGGANDLDVFAQLGFGYNVPGATNFTIDVDYTLGLLDVNKEGSESLKNSGFTINFGLLF